MSQYRADLTNQAYEYTRHGIMPSNRVLGYMIKGNAYQAVACTIRYHREEIQEAIAAYNNCVPAEAVGKFESRNWIDDRYVEPLRTSTVFKNTCGVERTVASILERAKK